MHGAGPTARDADRNLQSRIAATRRPAEYGDKLKSWIALGASPRGSLALDRCSRTRSQARKLAGIGGGAHNER